MTMTLEEMLGQMLSALTPPLEGKESCQVVFTVNIRRGGIGDLEIATRRKVSVIPKDFSVRAVKVP
jgi:hypothetical protein